MKNFIEVMRIVKNSNGFCVLCWDIDNKWKFEINTTKNIIKKK